MRMKNYIFILLLVFLLSVVSAESTIIKINTAPNFNVTASIKDASGYYYFQKADSGKDGSVTLTFDINSIEYELTRISIRRFPDTEDAYFQRFEDIYETGEFLELDFYPKWYTPTEPENETNVTTESNTTAETSETINETESVNETSPENSDRKVTAFSVSDGEIRLNSRMLLYAFGIMVLAVFTILFIRWERKKPKQEKKIKVTKLSEINKANNDEIKKQEERIEQAKKSLKEAQEELKKLKDPNLNKIEQAKKKLIEDQKELMRLREEAKKTENQNQPKNPENEKTLESQEE